jgi:hypothetical protein
VRDVQRGEVHQLERAELEADLVAQDAVDGGEVGHALAHDAQRLGVVAAAGVVDDEAGRVLRLHRRVAHLPGVGGQAWHTAGSVFSPAITSTTFISGTGLKKW